MKQSINCSWLLITISCFAVSQFLNVDADTLMPLQENCNRHLLFPSEEDKAYFRTILISANQVMTATAGDERVQMILFVLLMHK